MSEHWADPKAGWVLVAMPDPSGRRGLWMRYDVVSGFGSVELRAGREGADAHAKIIIGAKELKEVLETLIFASAGLPHERPVCPDCNDARLLKIATDRPNVFLWECQNCFGAPEETSTGSKARAT